MYDVIIIGSGPAGLAAAIYAKRATLETLVIEKQPVSGGQILNTYEVDNYPGLPGIGGYELGTQFREHADKMGVEFLNADFKGLEQAGEKIKTVVTNKGNFETKTVILAMGAGHKVLGVAGEDSLLGMGVSYCATCDGAFFKGRTVAVVGGGDVALEDALFLARGCEKVYLIHRRDEFRGAKQLQKRVKETANITLVMDSVVDSIQGVDQVEQVVVRNVNNNEVTNLDVSGVFVAVGITPNTDTVVGTVNCNEGGYIVAGEDCKTSVPGVFAAGDLRTKALRQVVTAAADGANAVTSVEECLYSMD